MVELTQLRPHDLLRLAQPLDVVPRSAPFWVSASLGAVPWVVVRRSYASVGRIAVGVRGAGRTQRFAMEIPDTAVMKVLAPEALVARGSALKEDVPAARALKGAAVLLNGAGLPWGPTGSVGFELASGAPTVTASSDLDLLLRPDGLPARAALCRLYCALQRLPARVDCQIETDSGALALGELASGAREVLLRTPTGPRLIPTPCSRAA